jgi:hypothetical protein
LKEYGLIKKLGLWRKSGRVAENEFSTLPQGLFETSIDKADNEDAV